MAWTQTDLDALEAAIAAGKGARSIAFSDQVVTFNSIADMLALRAAMKAEIDAAAGRSKRYRVAATSKGV